MRTRLVLVLVGLALVVAAPIVWRAGARSGTDAAGQNAAYALDCAQTGTNCDRPAASDGTRPVPALVLALAGAGVLVAAAAIGPGRG